MMNKKKIKREKNQVKMKTIKIKMIKKMMVNFQAGKY